MDFVLHPWQFLLVALAGWINRQQQEVFDDLRTENQVLKQKLGAKRILLDDDQRRRLAVKGKVLGRKQLEEVGALFTPDTILRWHRQLVARKWDDADRRKPGRPRIRQVIVDLIPRFAKENPTWGYDRIQGALPAVGNGLERYCLSLKSECLDRLIPFGEQSVRNAIREFLVRYHVERNHQGLANAIITPDGEVWPGRR